MACTATTRAMGRKASWRHSCHDECPTPLPNQLLCGEWLNDPHRHSVWIKSDARIVDIPSYSASSVHSQRVEPSLKQYTGANSRLVCVEDAKARLGEDRCIGSIVTHHDVALLRHRNRRPPRVESCRVCDSGNCLPAYRIVPDFGHDEWESGYIHAYQPESRRHSNRIEEVVNNGVDSVIAVDGAQHIRTRPTAEINHLRVGYVSCGFLLARHWVVERR